MASPRLLRTADLSDAGQTAGMTRKTAFEGDGFWVGTARTSPGAVSGWHHHGAHSSFIYCIEGTIKIESGPGGRDVVEARAGEFIEIPPQVVHRESNPGTVEQSLVVTRVGGGPVLVNVDGPDA
jgi:uncharacterized RmlC-like cupin family protein